MGNTIRGKGKKKTGRGDDAGDMDPLGLNDPSSRRASGPGGSTNPSGTSRNSAAEPYKIRSTGLKNKDLDGAPNSTSSGYNPLNRNSTTGGTTTNANTTAGGGRKSSNATASSSSSRAGGNNKTSKRSGSQEDELNDPYEKFSQLFSEELKSGTSHLGPSSSKSWNWKNEDQQPPPSRPSRQGSSTSAGPGGDKKGPYESEFWAEDPRFNSAFSNIVLCPGCKTPNRVPYASKFKCYHCGSLVDPGTFNTRTQDEAGYFQEAVQECEIGVAVMDQKRKEILEEIEQERQVQVAMARSGIGEDNWRAEELFKDLQACRYTIVQLDRQKGRKLFEISDKLVDLINLYDHAEDMMLNWRMLKDAISNDDRVNMEIFLSELDPAFSGKCKRYVVWLMEKEREILSNLAFDAALSHALKDEDEDQLQMLIEYALQKYNQYYRTVRRTTRRTFFLQKNKLKVKFVMRYFSQVLGNIPNLSRMIAISYVYHECDSYTFAIHINEVREYELNYDVEFLLQQMKHIQNKKRLQREEERDRNSQAGNMSGYNRNNSGNASQQDSKAKNRRSFNTAGDEDDASGVRKPKAAGKTPTFAQREKEEPKKAEQSSGGQQGGTTSSSSATNNHGRASTTSTDSGGYAKGQDPKQQAKSAAAKPPGAAKKSSSSSSSAKPDRHPDVPPDLDFDEPISSQKMACEILGLEVGGYDEAAMKKAYRKKALEWHPDRQQNHGYTEDATRMFQKIKDALDYLQAYQKKSAAVNRRPPPSSGNAKRASTGGAGGGRR
ncbi:unnamed protein product [Amoebophrya sp. A120]|nr:unnamed protein product [Amoebophrya sp. A120]|eukprot:GSA120T00016338001.1